MCPHIQLNALKVLKKYFINFHLKVLLRGVSWLSGRVLNLRQRVACSSLTGGTVLCP